MIKKKDTFPLRLSVNGPRAPSSRGVHAREDATGNMFRAVDVRCPHTDLARIDSA
jgi:hypothetical protein